MGHTFISYARHNAEKVGALASALESAGVQVWLDERLTAGSHFDTEIETALAKATSVLVAWTPASIGSHWVRAEAGDGLERGILLPVLLEPVKPPLEFRRVQTIDLSSWKGGCNEDKFLQLLAAIKSVTCEPIQIHPRPIPALQIADQPKGKGVRAKLLRPALFLACGAILIVGAQFFWNRYYPSPERVGKTALAGLACSWLGVQRIAYANGMPFLEVEGAAFQDRATLANKIRSAVARDAQSEVRVDVSNVSALPPSLCDVVERFKPLRYAGPRRVELSNIQEISYYSIDMRKLKAPRKIMRRGEGYRIKIELFFDTFRPFAEIFAIHKDGSVSELGRLSQLKSNSILQKDYAELVSLSTDTSVNALVLIDSNRPIPSSIVVDSNLNLASFRELDNEAALGDWNVELIWFDPEKPSATKQAPRPEL